MHVRELARRWWLCLAALGCAGCSRAPSVEFLGTFFPAWMFCIIAALLITGLIRGALARREVEKKLGPLVVFYPSLVVAICCLLWLVLFS